MNKEKQKIIIIEDSLAHQMLVQDMLGEVVNNPFEIECCEKLGDGLSILQKGGFDLVLLDLSLPDSSGLETFRKVKECVPDLPIIILTVTEDDELTINALREGAQDYIVKGYISSKMLFRSVRYAIERKKVEVEKRKVMDQLIQSQKIETVGRLAEGIAHDFNNILSSIKVMGDSVLLSLDESDDIYADMKSIQYCTILAENLIKELLVFSRRQAVEMKPVNLNETLSSILNVLRRLIGEDIVIECELNEDLGTVTADEGNVEQIVMNMMLNARDAMPDGGRVKIKTENIRITPEMIDDIPGSKEGEFAVLTIEDTGTGISKEIIPAIFDAFFTTKEPGKGTGLGLAVTKAIIEQHGGWLTVSSVPGEGAKFSVYFPAGSVEKKKSSKKVIPADGIKGRGETILLIEDEDTLRDAVKKILKKNNYSVIEARSMKEAYAAFKKAGSVDLVFSDIVLPDGTGLELIDRLKEHKPKLKILLCTGYFDSARLNEARKKNYTVMKKPYSLYGMLNKIREALSS
ncbi:MAG: response regulator [Elusimicrobiota bacterium]